MPKAIWKDAVLADSAKTVIVEGNHYFPPESLVKEHFKASETSSVCGWKGQASYYSIEVGGETNADAAWYYPQPLPEASQIKDHVAFWKGVEIVD